jgi:Mg2+/citrate symporter
MQLHQSLWVQVDLMVAAATEETQFPQRRAVTQHLALSLRLAAATAEPSGVHQPTVVLVVAAVGTLLLNESLLELSAKVIRAAVQTAIVMVAMAVAAAQRQ